MKRLYFLSLLFPALVFLFSPFVALADYTVTSTALTTPVDNLGYLNQPSDATMFTSSAAGTIASIAFNIKKLGSPVGSLKVDIETDASGVPSGTSLGTASANASSVGTSCVDFTFTFGTPPSISASTLYWAVITSNDTLSSTNYYNTCGTTPHATGFSSAYFNSSTVTWNLEDLTNRFSFTVTTGGGGGSVIRSGITTFFGWF